MNKLSIFILSLFALVFTACYEDKGNYDYSDPLTIEVKGIEDIYRVVTLRDTIHFRPKITPADRQYECFWGIFQLGGYSSRLDTLSFEQNWDFPVNLATGNYRLRFYAKDKETGMFSYTEYTISVETDLTDGWWILKEKEGNTDMDFFTPDLRFEDVIFANNGRCLGGSPQGLYYTGTYWDYDSAQQSDVKIKVIYVVSGQDMVLLDFYSGKIVKECEQLFYEAPVNRNFQDLFRGQTALHLLNNNQIYTVPTGGNGHYKQFTSIVTGNYLLSPYRIASGEQPLLFDELSSSFCTTVRTYLYMTYFKEKAPLPSPNQMNMDLLFMGAWTASKNADHTYALMKTQEKEEYWLVELASNIKNFNNPIKKITSLDKSLGILHADNRTVNQDNGIIYFSQANTIYAFNPATFKEEPQSLNIPPQETITYMEYLKYSPYKMEAEWFDYVAIGTTQGGCYKIYLCPVQAGNLQPVVRILEGEGIVKRAMYAKMSGNTVYTTTLY